MKPENKVLWLERKAAQDKAKAEWKAADKPPTATVKSLDSRLKAVEKLLRLTED